MENTRSISFPYNSQDEYEQRQRVLLREVIKEVLSQSDKKVEEDKYLTRKEVAKLLHISLPTLHNLTIEGKLTGYRLKGRVLYKFSEVDTALEQIETINYSQSQSNQ